MTKSTDKPTLRILHHMARSGGTIIGKCLGSMGKIVLLSEIHPHGLRRHNPVQQAHEWFRLFTTEDLQVLQTRAITFVEAIEMIRQRVEASGRYLLIRDWSHLDFTGIPFIERPSYRLTTADTLREHYHLIQATTVRHPLDQWISLNKVFMFKHMHRPQPGPFIQGYLRFAECATGIGYVRYEDFVRHPDTVLQELCEKLQLPFDVSYSSKWSKYQNITGDNTTPSASRLLGRNVIQPLPRQSCEDGIIEELQRNSHYQKAVKLLGYGE